MATQPAYEESLEQLKRLRADYVTDLRRSPSPEMRETIKRVDRLIAELNDAEVARLTAALEQGK